MIINKYEIIFVISFIFVMIFSCSSDSGQENISGRDKSLDEVNYPIVFNDTIESTCSGQVFTGIININNRANVKDRPGVDYLIEKLSEEDNYSKEYFLFRDSLVVVKYEIENTKLKSVKNFQDYFLSLNSQQLKVYKNIFGDTFQYIFVQEGKVTIFKIDVPWNQLILFEEFEELIDELLGDCTFVYCDRLFMCSIYSKGKRYPIYKKFQEIFPDSIYGG